MTKEDIALYKELLRTGHMRYDHCVPELINCVEESHAELERLQSLCDKLTGLVRYAAKRTGCVFCGGDMGHYPECPATPFLEEVRP